MGLAQSLITIGGVRLTGFITIGGVIPGGGGGSVTHASTTGQTPNDHHAEIHAATHDKGAADPLTVEDLSTASATLTHVLAPDGAGGLTMRAEASGGTVWTVAIEATAARSAAGGEFVLVNAATCVVTLPAPVANARVAVKAIAVPATATSIEIRTSGAGITIDGTDYSATGLPLAEQFEMVTAISDGSNWWIY